VSLDQLHQRLGHISPDVARRLVSNKLVSGVRVAEMSSGDPFFCESCVYAKATRKPVPKQREGDRATEFSGEIHSDLWGLAPVESKGRKHYYITYTDDKTRLTNIYFLAKKSGAFDSYKDYEAWVDTQLDAKIKCLHSDKGGEYEGREFVMYLRSRGTAQKRTVHDTPQQNGVAERRNCVIVEWIHALLHASGLPRFLWAEAARHVVWLMNRTSTKAVEGQTPYEAAFGKKPDLRDVREWGEKVWVRVEGGDKLGGRVKEGRWMGLDDRSKGVRVYWPDKKTVSVERNVYYDPTGTSASRLEGEDWEFIETKADQRPGQVQGVINPAATNPGSSTSLAAPHTAPAQTPESDAADSEASSDQAPALRRSSRTRKPGRVLRDILEGRAVTGERRRGARTPKIPEPAPVDDFLEPEGAPPENADAPDGEGDTQFTLPAADFVQEYAMVAEISEAEALEPRNLKEAKARPDWPLWEKAIEEELKVLKESETWELVVPPDGANIIGSKWVFRAKKDAAGNVVRYKARLVAQGFSQVPGIDYFDTFAPVACLASIRAILAYAAALDLEIHQIDIKGAYLNGLLTKKEVIYMRQPPGYHTDRNLVCRLLKALYGLKQSGLRASLVPAPSRNSR
jgi:hypothetical protein